MIHCATKEFEIKGFYGAVGLKTATFVQPKLMGHRLPIWTVAKLAEEKKNFVMSESLF